MQTKEKTVVISDPLIKRIWIHLGRNSDASIEDALETFLFRNAELYNIEISFRIDSSSEEGVDSVISIIQFLRQFKINKDKSFPRTSLYIPCHQATHYLAETIDQVDRYEPRIRVILTVTEEDVARAEVIEQIEDAVALFSARHIEYRFLFLIEEEISSLRAMINIIDDLFAQDIRDEKSIFMTTPILEINPHIIINDTTETAQVLVSFFSKHPEMISAATEGPCGFISLLFRVKSLFELNKENGISSVIPVLPCAAGSTPSNKWNSNKKKHSVSRCFYTPINLFPQRIVNDVVRNRCLSCNFIDSCGTCSISTLPSLDCNFYSFVETVVKLFSSNSALLKALTPEKPLVNILALDWDYIFD